MPGRKEHIQYSWRGRATHCMLKGGKQEQAAHHHGHSYGAANDQWRRGHHQASTGRTSDMGLPATEQRHAHKLPKGEQHYSLQGADWERLASQGQTYLHLWVACLRLCQQEGSHPENGCEGNHGDMGWTGQGSRRCPSSGTYSMGEQNMDTTTYTCVCQGESL